jgi:hypothetical protein
LALAPSHAAGGALVAETEYRSDALHSLARFRVSVPCYLSRINPNDVNPRCLIKFSAINIAKDSIERYILCTPVMGRLMRYIAARARQGRQRSA